MSSEIIAIMVCSTPVLVAVALALPPALRERSWARFFIALGVSFAGIVAAMRGHEQVVGPSFWVTRGGQSREVNRQLVTLWRLEQAWTRCSPVTHSAFRHVYNAIGPVLARQITSPLVADIVYLAVKPLEFIGRLVVESDDKGERT